MTDATVRELAEHLAARLGATSGKRRLTLIFVDGRYVDGYGEERLPPRDLEQLHALADELVDRAAAAAD